MATEICYAKKIEEAFKNKTELVLMPSLESRALARESLKIKDQVEAKSKEIAQLIKKGSLTDTPEKIDAMLSAIAESSNDTAIKTAIAICSSETKEFLAKLVERAQVTVNGDQGRKKLFVELSALMKRKKYFDREHQRDHKDWTVAMGKVRELHDIRVCSGLSNAPPLRLSSGLIKF